MLLLLNGSVQGVFNWTGPNSTRTVLVEPEFRIVVTT